MKPLIFLLPLFLFVFSSNHLSAQTPSDAIMMGNGQICIAALYMNESWDEYWEGTLLRDNGNIGTFSRQTIMPMIALGLGERLNVITALPYVFTKSDQGYLAGVNGLQDWGIWLKAKALDLHSNAGDFTTHATVGFSIPASDYLEDYAPYSLGLGCADLSLRGIFQYKLHSGPYLRAQAGYHIRGNAKIERDYYYTTHGIYSDEVDMPNAVTYQATLGSWFFNNILKVEAYYDGMKTLGGFDIRRQDAGFPSNKMIFTRIGGGFQIFPGQSGLGVLASYGQVLSGRNVGKASTITAGITYQFPLWNKNETETIDN